MSNLPQIRQKTLPKSLLKVAIPGQVQVQARVGLVVRVMDHLQKTHRHRVAVPTAKINQILLLILHRQVQAIVKVKAVNRLQTQPRIVMFLQ